MEDSAQSGTSPASTPSANPTGPAPVTPPTGATASSTLGAPPTSSPIQPAKPKGKFPLAIVVGVIVFLITGSIVGFLYKDQIMSIGAKPTPTPTTSSTEVSTKVDDPTANWTSYENIKNGYSLKYPSEIFARKLCPSEELLLQLKSEGVTDDTKEAETCARDSSFDLEILTSVPSRQEPISDKIFTVTKNEILVGGEKAIKYITTHSDPESSAQPWRAEVNVDHNGKRYVISFGVKDKEDVFDQILTTFKFTDSQTLDTSTWKTYDHKVDGYSFKYPSDWSVKTNGSTTGSINLTLGPNNNPDYFTITSLPRDQELLKCKIENTTITTLKNINIGDIKSTYCVLEYSASVNVGKSFITTFIPTGGDLKMLEYKAEDIEAAETYDNILSTLKFTN